MRFTLYKSYQHRLPQKVILHWITSSTVSLSSRHYTVCPYKILRLSPNATKEQVKKAYIALSKTYHPDINQTDSNAHDKYVEIQEAYNILSNDEMRREYDEAQNKLRKMSFNQRSRDFEKIVKEYETYWEPLEEEDLRWTSRKSSGSEHRRVYGWKEFQEPTGIESRSQYHLVGKLVAVMIFITFTIQLISSVVIYRREKLSKKLWGDSFQK